MLVYIIIIVLYFQTLFRETSQHQMADMVEVMGDMRQGKFFVVDRSLGIEAKARALTFINFFIFRDWVQFFLFGEIKIYGRIFSFAATQYILREKHLAICFGIHS